MISLTSPRRRNMCIPSGLSLGLCLILSPHRAIADEPTIDFATDILPILSDKCFVCHGPDTPADIDLRLDSYEAATEDRGGYRAIDPDDPESSELIIRIESEDDPMPPADADKQLSDRERNLIRRWVEQGGDYADHWAFVTPKKRASLNEVPLTADNAIDLFVGEKLAANGLEFAPEADRSVLARRIALTLIGLPPEPQWLDTFLQNDSEAALSNYVNTLLADPRYGEHRARYWLDAVRYGDTHGLHLDNRRGIYPYRDWVVRTFNQNLPFDDFITWQLAGDLLDQPSMDEQIATGFVRMNPSTSEGGVIPAEFQAKNNFDRTETLGTVLLGMTLTCARCHTHKYDPITQTEYYELLAFFNSTAESPLDGNSYTYGPTLEVPNDQSAWVQWQVLLDQTDQLISSARDLVPEFEEAASSADKLLASIADASGPWAEYPDLRKSAASLIEKREAAKSQFTTTLVAKDLPSPRETRLLRRGEYDMPTGDPLNPGVPEVMGELSDDMPKNRLGLAKWLTNPDHPLVARVIVNRLWQQVFGYGLVRTPEDFGVQGQRPTHPALLDWLAVEFMKSGWDVKHMLRMMVTSRTFRQASAIREGIEDPENLLFARGPRYRLDAEVLRDIALWSSGLLDPRLGGEGVKPYQPDGMWKAMAHPASNTKQYVRDDGEKLYRRSLYVYWKRTSPHPMMTLFDAPDRESSCVRRSRTSTPLQSLALFNETQRIEMSKKLAERLLDHSESNQERIDFLFRLVASRNALAREREACEQLLEQLQDRYANSPADADALLSTGDAKVREEFSPSELAAWTQVCVTVLASDLAIMNY